MWKSSTTLFLLAACVTPLASAAATKTSATGWETKPKCTIKPLSMAFGNVTILQYPDLPAAHRGLKMQVGSEEKQLSVNIATTTNTTFFADGNAVCNQTATDARQCIFWRGGLFPVEDSESWVKETGTVAYNGSASNEGYDALHQEAYKTMGEDPLSQFPRGWDTLQLGEREIDGAPITIIDNPDFPFGPGMLGLASNSRFLESAVAAGVSPAHSWGLDYGEIDSAGEFVLGGFNSAKSVAHFSDFKQYDIFADKSIPCPLQINISSIKLGSSSKALNTKPFTACLEPAIWDMVLPLEVQSGFNKSINSQDGVKFASQTWEYFYYNVTGDDAKFNFEDVHMTLDNGLAVTIPPSEMVQTRQDFNPKGGWVYMTTDHVQVSLGTAGFAEGKEPMVQLGGPFLSQVYLAVDYENMKFGLAPIKRGSDSSDLKELGCEEGSSSSSSSNISISSTKQKDGTSTATIAGAAAGGVVALLAILVGILFLLRRKKNAAKAAAAAQDAAYANKAQYEGRPPGEMAPPMYPGAQAQNAPPLMGGQGQMEEVGVQQAGGYYYEAASTPIVPKAGPTPVQHNSNAVEMG